MSKVSASESALRPERSLIFFNGQFAWVRRTKAGEQVKFVSPAAVLQAMKAAPVDSGWLQPGVVRAGSTARGDFAVMIVPAGRHAMPFERANGKGVETLTLHLPVLAFFGYGQSYQVWALKAADNPARAALYHAPLPNVFGNGGICWGQNTPPAASAATITAAWMLFLSSPFNGHAASGKVKGEAGDVRGFLRGLSRSGKKFPADRLLPFRQYENTLEAAVAAALGGHPQ